MLSKPPALEHLFLESPWPMVFALLAVGLVLLFIGNRRLNKRFMLIGLTALVLAAGMLIVAETVETDREALALQTRKLLDATAPFNESTLNGIIDAKGFMTGPSGERWIDLDDMMQRVKSVGERFQVQLHTLRQLEVEADRSRGRSWIEVRSLLSRRPVDSQWLLSWERTTDGRWRMTQIQWLKINGEEPARISW